jgi:hypothetical protein
MMVTAPEAVADIVWLNMVPPLRLGINPRRFVAETLAVGR